MRLLDRYIGREVASHAALGLAIFTFVFFVPQLVHLMELVVRHSGGVGTVSLLFLCTLPPVLVFTIPMAVLVGVLIGLGRLSSDSEIVALHASGVSLRRLLVPIGFVALVGALVTLLMTFWLSPASLRTLRRLQNKVLSSEVPFAVQPRVFDERFPHLILYVQDVEAAATRWSGVFLASSGGPGGTAIWFAKDAIVISGQQRSQIELHLGAGSAHEYDPRYPSRYNVTTFGDSDIPIDLSGTNAAPRNTSISPAEQYVPALLANHGPTALESRVELENRIAFPAACLVFALLGVPIGVHGRRGGRAAGMILTLVLIAGYYFIWITGDHLARQGRIAPSAGIWAANFVTALLGAVLFLRIENTRKTYIFGWLELFWSSRQKAQIGNPATVPIANGPVAPSPFPVSNGPISLAAVSSPVVSYAPPSITLPSSPSQSIRQARSAVGFPMMIDFYLLQEFFYHFALVLTGFLLIFDAFTLFDILGDISKNRVPFLTVLNYFRFLVPFLVYQLAPLATLVATLVTLAVLAKNNEVIAFKASGVSLYRLILPLAFAGCLLAGGMFLLDNTFLPYANQRQDALRNEIKGRPAQTYFQPARQWIFGENNKIYNYELFDSDRQLFGGLNVFELDPATFQLRRRVFATRATWEPTENTWVLTGGWVREFNSVGRVSSFYPFKAFSLPELSEPPSYFRREVRQYYQLNWRQLGQYIASLRQAGFDIARLSVQWQKKFAFPLIAPIIVLLGAPFAFLVGTRGAIGGLALGVAISVVYWATAALFEAMGSIGQLPPFLAAWAPDAIFGFLAVYFSLRMPT
jgi:LPS export ABC transporter permease LptF/LPS export ABC transporter permease LptG